MAKDMRELLDERSVVRAPGAWDGLSGRLVEAAGFEAVCSSGYAVSAGLGMPDVELYTASECVAAIGRIREATTVPLVADIDTGYGNAMNVMRTVRAAERAGATAVFMEDQVAPKRCPVCVGDPVDVLDADEAAAKVRAAADAKDGRTVLIARTDATGDEALRRLEAYRDAGADLLMPVTKSFRTTDEWAAAHERLGTGLVASLTAGTWVEHEFTPDVQREVGVRIALLPNQAVHAAAGAIEDALRRMADGEPLPAVTADAMEHGAFIQMLGFDDAIAQQTKYLAAAR
ncbi:isocitrate lyase/PEP mutase family protein [Patulibacter sp. S7RM1-6]